MPAVWYANMLYCTFKHYVQALDYVVSLYLQFSYSSAQIFHTTLKHYEFKQISFLLKFFHTPQFFWQK